MPLHCIDLPNGPKATIFDRNGKLFGHWSLWRDWLFHDEISATLRVEGRDDWNFETLLPTSPAHLCATFLSSAERNLVLLSSSRTVIDRIGTRIPRRLPHGLSRFFRRALKGIPLWQVAVLETDPMVPTSSRARTLFPLEGVLRADPFPIQHRNQSWILFEELLPGDRGRFRAARLEHGEWVVQPEELLALPHHLSWPQTIEIDGKLFLLPETGEAGEVALWECEKFPRRWIKRRTLLTGRNWHDASLFRLGEIWWLFVSAGGRSSHDHSAELQAFHSPDPLTCPFQPHASNPLSVSVAGSRPAGVPFFLDGQLIRPVQDCRAGYGTAVILRRVDELTPTTWGETNVGLIEPPKGSVGIHTLNNLPGVGWIVDICG